MQVIVISFWLFWTFFFFTFRYFLHYRYVVAIVITPPLTSHANQYSGTYREWNLGAMTRVTWGGRCIVVKTIYTNIQLVLIVHISTSSSEHDLALLNGNILWLNVVRCWSRKQEIAGSNSPPPLPSLPSISVALHVLQCAQVILDKMSAKDNPHRMTVDKRGELESITRRSGGQRSKPGSKPRSSSQANTASTTSSRFQSGISSLELLTPEEVVGQVRIST